MGNNKPDYLFEEWKQCRAAIARFDNTIYEIRKYGFTIITGVLSADAFLMVKIEELTFPSKVVISVIMMALIFALFMIDRHNQIFLRGAVKRAKIIEYEKGTDLELTAVIGADTYTAGIDTWGSRLYRIFFLVAAAIPIATFGSSDDDLWPLVIGLVLLLICGSAMYFRMVQYDQSTRVFQQGIVTGTRRYPNTRRGKEVWVYYLDIEIDETHDSIQIRVANTIFDKIQVRNAVSFKRARDRDVLVKMISKISDAELASKKKKAQTTDGSASEDVHSGVQPPAGDDEEGQ